MAQQTRPFIGINADFIAGGKQTTAHARLHAGYLDAILSVEGLPIIIPPLGTEREIDALLDRLDGVVLSGGLDIDPKRSGGEKEVRNPLPDWPRLLTPAPPSLSDGEGWDLKGCLTQKSREPNITGEQFSHPAVQPMCPRRQQSDQILVRRIVERQMPVLGIGLGMQQLNVACGGTLYLHLPDDLPRSLPHRDKSGEPHRHAVLLEPSTRIDEIYGGGEIRVNSSHHQAVRKVGVGLRVGALAPDGVIEAIETEDPNWFCIGVQWHPESEVGSALDVQLFECFVHACVRQSQSLQLAV